MEIVTIEHIQLVSLSVVTWVVMVLVYRHPQRVQILVGAAGLVYCVIGIPACLQVPVITPFVLLSAACSVWLLVLGARSSAAVSANEEYGGGTLAAAQRHAHDRIAASGGRLEESAYQRAAQPLHAGVATARNAQDGLPRCATYGIGDGDLTIELKSPKSELRPVLVVVLVVVAAEVLFFGRLTPEAIVGSTSFWALLPVTALALVFAVVVVLITGPLASHSIRLEKGGLTVQSRLGPFRIVITKREPSPADVYTVDSLGPQVRVRSVEVNGVGGQSPSILLGAKLTDSEAHAIAKLMTDYLEGESAGAPAAGVQ